MDLFLGLHQCPLWDVCHIMSGKVIQCARGAVTCASEPPLCALNVTKSKMLCCSALTVNLTQPRITWDENLSEKLSGSGCGHVYERWSWLLIDTGSSSPLWATPFPRQRTLAYLTAENKQSPSMYTFIFALLDVMWWAASSSCLNFPAKIDFNLEL